VADQLVADRRPGTRFCSASGWGRSTAAPGTGTSYCSRSIPAFARNAFIWAFWENVTNFLDVPANASSSSIQAWYAPAS